MLDAISEIVSDTAFMKLEKTNCKVVGDIFLSREDAQQACIANADCEGILDDGCNDGGSDSICIKGNDITTDLSKKSSCVLRKIPIRKLNVK